MKKLILLAITLALVFGAVYLNLSQKGYTVKSILNYPSRKSISIVCSKPYNMEGAKRTSARIINNSNKVYNNTILKVIGYDIDGEVTEVKVPTITRSIGPNAHIEVPVELPVNTVWCNCIVLDSESK